MKYLYTFLIAVLMTFSVSGQKNQMDVVAVGDELILGSPTGNRYTHVKVPRKNFIIKRGGLPNMASLKNTAIVVTDVVYGEKTLITFKRTDGRKFFRVYKTLSANLEGGIDSGELIIPQYREESTKESE
ncbi:hypothetical protein [Flagellimonas sp. 2504JD1-5]